MYLEKRGLFNVLHTSILKLAYVPEVLFSFQKDHYGAAITLGIGFE